ncbi:MAG: hypothetical protein V4585_02245 [Bacteroidota bacterium]
MKIYRNFILILSGCILMSFEKSSEVNPERAKIVFLHERAFWGYQVEIKINNQQVILLPSNKYFTIEVEAGNIQIAVSRGSISSPEIQTTLTAEPDKIYYLKIYREIDYFTNKLYLVRESEQTAKQAMKSMKSEKIPLKNE